jgi:O-antigen ligase
VLYVGGFLAALAVLARERPEWIWQGLAIAFVFLALSCPVSFYFYYIRDMHPLSYRLYGIGQISHPILGAYVMALVVVWGAQFRPLGWWKCLLWGGLLLLALAFIVLGQSRGAMLALIIGICAMPLWGGGRVAWIGCISILIAAWVGYQLFEPLILQRGLSYRPEIFLASLEMVAQKPFMGLGIGSDYRVVTANYPEGFDHSHNGFTHVAIELGIMGVVLWVGLWMSAFRIAWNHRQSREGRLVLGSLVVSLVALQFDASSLWDTPRAEWFITWLPLALALALVARPQSARLRSACLVVS